MKKFYFEADKKQWEKPTEPKYMFCATAKVWAVAETEEEARAIALGLKGPYTSWRHMFWWNIIGLPLMGPAVATLRFFDTLNRVEAELNRRNGQEKRT